MGKAAFIIGGSHHNTLGVIRALGSRLPADDLYLFIDRNDKSVCKSRYLNKKNIFFFDKEEQLPQMIIDTAQTMTSKPVVVCCGDQYIEAIDNAALDISKYCIVPHGASPGDICRYLDKAEQRRLACETGLKMASEFSLHGSIEYPCIVKPLNSTKGSKSEIYICHSQADLDSCLTEIPENHTFIIEQYIDKETEFQLIGCSLNEQIIIPGYTDIIRQPHNTNTGYLKYSPIEDGFISKNLLEKVEKFIRKIGYEGLFSAEFIRAKDGQDYFLEINMRNDGNAFCVTTAGVNLPYIWYKYADTQKSAVTEATTFKKPIYWLPEDDLRSIRTIGVFQWLKEWFSADSHAYTCFRDPIPALHYFYHKTLKLLKSV